MHVYEVGGAMVLEPQGVKLRAVVLLVTGHSFSVSSSNRGTLRRTTRQKTRRSST